MKSKIILAALTLCCLLCFGACAQKEGIVGSWETKAASLGSSENQPADNRVIFRFEADLTGKETQIVNGASHARDFTYTLSDGNRIDLALHSLTSLLRLTNICYNFITDEVTLK